MNISRRDFLKGTAAAAAVSVLGIGSFASTEAAAEEITVSSSVDCDVAIVGAGAAGLQAALKLSQAGKKVIILEKGLTAMSSNFSLCGGPAAAHTKLQEAAGCDVPVDVMFAHMNAYANHTVNSALLRNVLECTGEALDTMSEELGIPLFVMEDTYGVGFRGRHMFMAQGQDRIMPFVNAIEANGGEFMYQTPAKKLVYEDGVVKGVIAKNASKEYVQVNAGAVVLCTGGFQGNKEMLSRFFGNINVKSLGMDTCAGDGIAMVEEIGGALDRNFCLLGNEGSATTTKIEGPIYNFATGKMPNSNLAFGLHGGLLVDRSGDRFCNEKDIADFPLAWGGELFARAGKSYAIIDSATFEAATTVGPYAMMGEPENWIAGKALWFPVLADAKDRLDEAKAEGWACTGDTLAEIAEYFGLENLEETVAEYNAMCEAGVDSKFSKAPNFMRAIGEGPYYCFEYEAACWSTNGGVKTDARLRAIGDDQKAIPGLYVAGVDNGSMYSAPYYDNEGASVGLAIGSGVFVAKQVLKYLG